MVDTNQNGKFAHSLESEQATPQKGEIYWVDMPYYSTTVISNIRPCVVLSNNQANKNSKTILVTPITRRLKRPELQDLASKKRYEEEKEEHDRRTKGRC